MSRRNVIIFIAAVLVLGVGGFLYFRNQAAAAAATTAASLRTTQVTRGDLIASVSAAGSIAAPQTATLTWSATGTVGKVNAAVGQVVQAGDVLMELDPRSLDHTFVQAEADLLAAQQSLQTLLAGPTDQQLAQARLAVVTAGQAVTTAQRTLDNVNHPAGQALYDAIAAAQVTFDTAQTNSTLERVSSDASSVQTNLNSMNNAYSQVQRAQTILDDCIKISCAELNKYQNALTNAQNTYQADKYAYEAAKLQYDNTVKTQDYNLSTAEQTLKQAKTNLTAAQAGPDQSKVTLYQAQLDVARAGLKQAQADLADLQAQPKQADIVAAQAKIAAAQAAVDQARLIAPIRGTVMAINTTPGSAVASGTTAIVLAELSSLQIQIDVSEVDINRIAIGQVVNLTADAVPGKTFYGAVSAILALGKSTQGVVTFPVTVVITNPDPALKPSMTAAAAIVTEEHKNVLLVPNRAIRAAAGQRSVTVLFEGQQIPVPVTVGLANDTESEILDGGQLREGDFILTTVPATTTGTGGGFGGGGFLFGGGRGPGG